MESATATVDERRAAMECRHPAWVPMTLDRYLAKAVSDFGGRPLVITDDAVMTYAEIDAAATRIAQMLRNRGIRAGDRVAMLMVNYPITVALLFGIWRAEATAVPLNTLSSRKARKPGSSGGSDSPSVMTNRRTRSEAAR